MERFADERHLWPSWVRLIAERTPATVFGEQVAGATEWLRLVRGDLDALGYAVGCAPIEAASAGADHLRDRFWFVADYQGEQVGTAGQSRQHGDVAHANVGSQSGLSINGQTCRQRGGERLADADSDQPRRGDAGEVCHLPETQCRPEHGAAVSGRDCEWVIGADGKARRVEPGVRLLADGVSNRVGKLRGFGNAIDPRPAAAFIAAFMDVEDG